MLAATTPDDQRKLGADVMSETVFTGDAPSMKYTVPATLAVTTAALGNLLLSMSVADKDTDGTKTAVVDVAGMVDGAVGVTAFGADAGRTKTS